MPDFQSAYDRIREATGLRTQGEVAAELGIRQSSISDAKRRNSLPDQWLLTLLDKHALNPAWIRSGEGPHHLIGSDGQPPIPLRLEQCAPRLEPLLRAALLTTVPALAAELREALGTGPPSTSTIRNSHDHRRTDREAGILRS